MKRKFLSISLILVILVSMTSALAAPRRASDYLAGYGISIEAQGNGLMEVFYDVDGTGWMTKIGAQALFVEYKDGNTWRPYETILGIEHPEFYAYNALGHSGYAYFTGKPGVEYRVTLQAYAGDSTGSDTGTITSFSETCE